MLAKDVYKRQDENGVIEAAMPKVKPDTNASEILTYLEKKNAADIQ